MIHTRSCQRIREIVFDVVEQFLPAFANKIVAAIADEIAARIGEEVESCVTDRVADVRAQLEQERSDE